jgi:hypothetical protein
VHDPEKMGLYENYSHVELRELAESEGFDVEPPRRRRFKSKKKKNLRLAWRENLAIRSFIELETG